MAERLRLDMMADRQRARSLTIPPMLHASLGEVRSAFGKGDDDACERAAFAHERVVLIGLRSLIDDEHIPSGVRTRLQRLADLEAQVAQARLETIIYASRVLDDAKLEEAPHDPTCGGCSDAPPDTQPSLVAETIDHTDPNNEEEPDQS
jgi:hypothetical protein